MPGPGRPDVTLQGVGKFFPIEPGGMSERDAWRVGILKELQVCLGSRPGPASHSGPHCPLHAMELRLKSPEQPSLSWGRFEQQDHHHVVVASLP